MDRAPVRRVGGHRERQPHGWAVAAFVVFALLWVPTVGRALEPIAGHLAPVLRLAKLNKSAVLPHDPADSLSYIVPIGQPVPARPESLSVVFVSTDPLVRGRGHVGIGLRAPPAFIA